MQGVAVGATRSDRLKSKAEIAGRLDTVGWFFFQTAPRNSAGQHRVQAARPLHIPEALIRGH